MQAACMSSLFKTGLFKLLYAISGYWGYNISRNPFGMKEKIGEVEIYDEKNI